MSDSIKSWIYLIVISIIWGSSFLLIKLGLMDSSGNERLRPELLASIRMTLAFLVLIPFVIFYIRKTYLKDLPFLIIAGILGNGLPAFLFSYAEIYLSSALTGMLNSLVPVFTILIAVLIFGFVYKKKHVLGILISLIGTFFIINIYDDLNSISWLQVIPILLVMSGSLCYAISLNVIKYKLAHLHANHITSISFLFAGVPCIIHLLFSDFTTFIQENPISQDGIIAVIILALVCTSFAVILFNHLIKLSSPVFSSSVTFIIPIVALILGVFYGEEVSSLQIAGLFLLLIGVLIINQGNLMLKLKELFNFE